MPSSDQRPMTANEVRVIFASSLGTVFEWYDFYLYGTLAPIIGKQFFSRLHDGSAFIFALLAFAAGFIVRPFGALVFGRLGDMIGRKYTFLITILIMGLSTFIVGIVPDYATIGVAAPVVLIGLRLLQGLALGGEYGGAATLVAEHAPAGQRGFYTAWVQTTATLGLLLSVLVILGARHVTGELAFAEWGWRIPFLASVGLLTVSIYIRMSMRESPAFLKIKAAGRISHAPLAESFGTRTYLWRGLVALFGLTAGQAVIWYSGQFYALYFLTQSLKVDSFSASAMMAIALLIGTPFFLLSGALSDRIGRKPVVMAGCLLAVLTFFPVFHALARAANPDLAQAQSVNRVLLLADPADCSFQFNPLGTTRFTSSCDLAKQALASESVSYDNVAASPGALATIAIGSSVVTGYSAQGVARDQVRVREGVFRQALVQALTLANYPGQADRAKVDAPRVIALLIYLIAVVAMVYGPMAALLVEMFPTRIRYTAMSLPYHIGNGWFGGLLPTTTFAIVAQTGNMYNGLWYPVGIAAMTLVIGLLFVRETKGVNLDTVA